MASTAPVTVLLVEDDEIDIEAIQRGFKRRKIANPMRIARDGIEALEILRGSNGIEKIKQPYIILLDINMPRMNGLEFLETIRDDDELRASLVFILTTSDDDKDKLRAYQNHVAGYILKNKAGESFMQALELLEHYWRIVEFPYGADT